MKKKSAPQTVSRSASNPVSTAKPNAAPDAALSLRPDAGPDTEQRFIDIEMALSDLERTVEDLNDVIIRQGRDIAFLQKQNRFLTEALRNAQSTVKPLEEETPPPHY